MPSDSLNDGGMGFAEWWRGISAAWYYGKGKVAFKRGKYAEATKRFRRALELEPRNEETREWLAKSKRAAEPRKL